MSNWFLITSAINVDYGIYTLQQKFEQTCETIESIRKYCSDAKIILLEGSPKKPEENVYNHLREITDMYIDFSNDVVVQSMHRDLNTFAIKSPGEAYILGSFLSAQNFIKETDRVFKISGRYMLDENFDREFHESQKVKIVFLKKEPYTQYYSVESGTKMEPIAPFQYKTRLYSFCGSLSKYFTQVCFDTLNFFCKNYGVDFFSDIEHAMYRFVNHDLVVETDVIGVTGYSADRDFKPKE
jgi:hypothetical protein